MNERPDGRAPDQLRAIHAELGYQEWAEGSILFTQGHTRVLVSSSLAARDRQGVGHR